MHRSFFCGSFHVTTHSTEVPFTVSLREINFFFPRFCRNSAGYVSVFSQDSVMHQVAPSASLVKDRNRGMEETW